MNVQPFAIKTVDETVNFYVPVSAPKAVNQTEHFSDV